MTITRRNLAKFIAVTAVCAFGSNASAQSYPTEPITIVVGLSAGGATDITARLLATKLEPLLGGNVIVENRPGAGSMIAAESVARADPDGHTLFIGTGSFATNSALSSDLGFDPLKDLVPIVQVTSVPFAIAVHPSLGFKTVEDLVAYAKEHPDKLKYSSSGVGGQGHFAGELFEATAGVAIVHVPYEGAAPALTATINGEVPVTFTDIVSYESRVTDNGLQLLAVTSPARAAGAPDVPTLQELGFSEFNVVGWSVIFAPAGTPAHILERLSTAFIRVGGDEDFRAKMAREGAELVFGNRDAAKEFLAGEIELYRNIAADAEITKR